LFAWRWLHLWAFGVSWVLVALCCGAAVGLVHLWR
jgi:hypothetical protein